MQNVVYEVKCYSREQNAKNFNLPDADVKLSSSSSGS